MNRSLLAFVLSVPLVAGCAHGHGAGLLAAGIVTGAIIAEAANPPPPPPPEYVAVYMAPPPQAAPSPPAATAAPPRVLFDEGAAMVSVHGIDLNECVARGVPTGYGHARLTFSTDGAVTQVTVDKPAGLSTDAVACLGDKLGHADAPRFDGSPVTMGVGFVAHAE